MRDCSIPSFPGGKSRGLMHFDRRKAAFCCAGLLVIVWCFVRQRTSMTPDFAAFFVLILLVDLAVCASAFAWPAIFRHCEAAHFSADTVRFRLYWSAVLEAWIFYHSFVGIAYLFSAVVLCALMLLPSAGAARFAVLAFILASFAELCTISIPEASWHSGRALARRIQIAETIPRADRVDLLRLDPQLQALYVLPKRITPTLRRLLFMAAAAAGAAAIAGNDALAVAIALLLSAAGSSQLAVVAISLFVNLPRAASQDAKSSSQA